MTSPNDAPERLCVIVASDYDEDDSYVGEAWATDSAIKSNRKVRYIKDNSEELKNLRRAAELLLKVRKNKFELTPIEEDEADELLSKLGMK